MSTENIPQVNRETFAVEELLTAVLDGVAAGTVSTTADVEVARTKSRSIPGTLTQTKNLSHVDQREFVTFDSARKHLARIIGVNGKKVTVRRFDKKTGEWKTQSESIDCKACILLVATEAEEFFPGCVAAWEAAKLADTLGTGATATKGGNPNATAFVETPNSNDHGMEAGQIGSQIVRLSPDGSDDPAHQLVFKNRAKLNGTKTSNVQSLDISALPALLTPEEKHELIEDLLVVHQTVRRSVIEAGNILMKLRNGTPHGQWEMLLAEICKKLKFSRATAYNYMEAATRVAFLPQTIVNACNEFGIDLGKKPNRDAISEAITENPNATPDEIVKSVKAPPAPDINVVAREMIRQLESKRQAEKLEAAVEERKQLNPAIRADLIRALEAQARKLLDLAQKLKRGFRPLPVTNTGKAHQRFVREHRATLPDPLLEEKRKAAVDIKQARVEEISYDIAKNVILANEYLGTMPGGVKGCFGLYFGKHLASVVCFGTVGGTKVTDCVCGPEHAEKVTVLVRGATEHWAHKDSASRLIAEACGMMAAKGYPITVAYSDPAGGEVGQIYSACNFLYTGMTAGTEAFVTPEGKKHDSRQIHGLTRDRRNGELTYRRTRAEQKQLLVEQGCKFERVGGKHRFVLFSGDHRIKTQLRKALKWEVLPHPRREPQPAPTSASTVSSATEAIEASAAD